MSAALLEALIAQLGVHGVAARLEVSKVTVWRWRCRGVVPTSKAVQARIVELGRELGIEEGA